MTETDWLDEQEFYELMLTYRHSPLIDQPAVIAAFEAVKQHIRDKCSPAEPRNAGGRGREYLGDWQPIETAPKDGTWVLIVNDEGAMDVARYFEQFDVRSEFVRRAKDGDVYRTVREDIGYWDTDTTYCPTHWMPLPEAPNEKPSRAAPGRSMR